MADKVKYVELHETFFMCGVNLPAKLPGTRRDVTMEYDDKTEWLRITFKDETLEVPKTGIKGMIRGEPKAFATVKTDAPIVHGKITAQVSGPQSHVFAGLGAGKSR